MARKYLTHLDMQGNQIIKAVFEKLAGDPGSGNFEGRMYYNTALDVVRVYDGAKFVDASIPVVTSDPTTDNYEGRVIYNSTENMLKSFDGAAWLAAGNVLDIQAGTDIDVSASAGIYTISLESEISSDTTGNAATATALETGRIIALSGDVSGSVTFDGTASVNISTTIQPNSVALGTDTTGDYVASVSASTGISVDGSGEGAAVTITNTDKGSDQNIFKTIISDSGNVTAASNSASVTVSGGTGISTAISGSTLTVTNDGVVDITGTANEVEVSASVGSITIGLPDDVIVGQDLTVTRNAVVNGDLTVNGTTTYINTQDLNVKDNIVTLNYGLAASVAPTLDAGIEVARGASATVGVHWNETTDKWQATTDGTTYKNILLSGDTVASDISDFTEAAQDAVGGMLVDTATVNLTYTDAGTPELKADVTLQHSQFLIIWDPAT